ncbi:hypothetical protein [Salinicoccus sp. CNSTN-B1]
MSSTDSNKTRYPERNIEQYMEYEIINNRPGLLGISHPYSATSESASTP